MLVLANVSMIDLITICLITMACVITMVGILFVSSRKPKINKKQNEEVSFKLIEEEKSPKKKIENLNKEVKKEFPKEETIFEAEKKEPKKTNIEDVLTKMENELEHGPIEKKYTFEEEQEEKAIISYRELLKVAGKLKEEIKEHDDELEQRERPILKEAEVPKNPVHTLKNEKKFHTSDFISPIHGKQALKENEEKLRKNKSNENENDQFLTELKDLRKNLE